MAIRLVRLFTGDSGQSQFAVGDIALQQHDALNAVSSAEAALAITFEETAAGASLD